MSLFIDPKKEPTVYTNLFGKRIKRDFYNARMAARMEGQFSGKLSLKDKKGSPDGFDGYIYKYPGIFGFEVNIYDDTVGSSITPGKVAEAAERVIARMGKGFVKRVYIAKRSYSEDPHVDAVITKDIAILDGNRNLSASQLDEIMYIHGLSNLCDFAVIQNETMINSLYYETSTEGMLWRFYEEQKKVDSPIGRNQGWYFAYITEDIFKDKPYQEALASSERIIKEIKDCAESRDFTFAKTAMQYFKDQEDMKRNNYDYYLVMKRMIRLNPMGERPKLAANREELDKIIYGDNGARSTLTSRPHFPNLVDGEKEEKERLLKEKERYIGEEILKLNDPNHRMPWEG